MEREADAHLHLSPPCMSLTEISSFMDDFIYKQDPLAFSFLPEPAFVEGKLHLSLCRDSPLAPRGGACRAAWFRDSIMIGMCVDGCALEEQSTSLSLSLSFFLTDYGADTSILSHLFYFFNITPTVTGERSGHCYYQF